MAGFKFEGRTALHRPLARAMHRAYAQQDWRLPHAAVLAVPAGPKRLRRRGFDPAELLARRFCALQGLPYHAQVLRRCRKGLPQHLLSRQHRLRNPAGAFTASLPSPLHGQRLLLVDDVLTTGATAHACAKALLHAGAGGVDVLVVARSL
jgi:ComF family protein